MKGLITSDNAPRAIAPFSPGLFLDGWIFLSGQGGFDRETGRIISDDLVEQTEQTFRNIEALLQAAGATLDDVVSCLVHLGNLDTFAEFNAVYEKQFPGIMPVRTTVGADLVAGMLVEVTVLAKAT
jgi:2-iminobutanoate/2-iminopropanoate deaminase